MTTPLREALADAERRLAEAGVPSAGHDARALARHVLGLRRPADLLLVEDLDPPAYESFQALVTRRASREPLQHLTGRAGFRYLDLAVGPGVFVPRPETEVVVQWVVEALGRLGGTAPVVVDLCSGSGTIALSVANEVPHAVVHAVERDPAALEWCRRNAEERRLAGDSPVTLHLASAEEALPDLDGLVDVVVSNPPYVATSEAHIPDPEVLEHDPGPALWAGEDGLDVVRLVESAARRLLRPGGLLAVEHSDRQGTSAPALLRGLGGWADVTDHPDLTGRDRFVTARRAG